MKNTNLGKQLWQHPSASGIVLFVFTVLALALANSGFRGVYEAFWHVSIGSLSLHHWLNDGLMAVFFLVVGLEIKQELLRGELSSRQKAALPIAAAIGGMIVPALLYVAFNFGKPGMAGWGIPMATDIAFAIGVLALLGSRVPTALKVFLTAFAIVDDIGAVLVIAFFYTASLSWISLGSALGIFVLLLVLNRIGVKTLWVYLALGALLWVAFLTSGIHPTLAGILLAFVIPLQLGKPLESRLHSWVAFGIMPLFAFGNAGVSFGGSTVFNSVSLGIIVGLVFGKLIGISVFSWLAVQLKLAVLPAQVSWWHLCGAACLGGIGFTMSLFISNLAFAGHGVMTDAAKMGILIASVISAIFGVLILLSASRKASESHQIQNRF